MAVDTARLNSPSKTRRYCMSTEDYWSRRQAQEVVWKCSCSFQESQEPGVPPQRDCPRNLSLFDLRRYSLAPPDFRLSGHLRNQTIGGSVMIQLDGQESLSLLTHKLPHTISVMEVFILVVDSLAARRMRLLPGAQLTNRNSAKACLLLSSSTSALQAAL